jgi:hypothetical protein
LSEGDLVLFKGSRMMELDCIVDQLLMETGSDSAQTHFDKT